jgi:hypothetical protein
MAKTRSCRTPAPGAFLVMDRAKQAAVEAGKSIQDLSVGSSDLQPPPEALAAMRVRAAARLTDRDVNARVVLRTPLRTAAMLLRACARAVRQQRCGGWQCLGR